MSDKDTCGYVKDSDGDPCGLPACRPDGRCWHHTEVVEQQRGGRDSKLTKQREEKIAQAIEDGKSITSAVRMAGISKPTFYRWMEWGEDEAEGLYRDFYDRIVRARGHGEDFYVRALIQIAKEEGDTATLMSMLKQQYPEEWGDVKRGEQAGGVVVQVGDSDEYEIDPDTLEVLDAE